VVQLTVPSDARFLKLIDSWCAEVCQITPGFQRKQAYYLTWCVHEACSNAIEHAHHFQSARPLRLEARILPDALEFRIYDSGTGFDPESVPSPDATGAQERGRGLFGMRQYLDRLEYRRGINLNCMRLVRSLRSSPPLGAGHSLRRDVGA
jgi:serine/threonine-protein kinase RsbW